MRIFEILGAHIKCWWHLFLNGMQTGERQIQVTVYITGSYFFPRYKFIGTTNHKFFCSEEHNLENYKKVATKIFLDKEWK